MKLTQEAITFILEDFVQIGLQFFYFEKYSFLPNDILVYYNAVFMVLKALELTVRMVLWMKEDWNDDDVDLKESFGKFFKVFQQLRIVSLFRTVLMEGI